MIPKILIVDNEEKWQDVLQKILQDKYGVFTVSNCDDAFDMLSKINFSLVTVNMNLSGIPEIDDLMGLKVLEDIMEKYPSLPRIVLTGHIKGPIFRRYLSLGVTEVLPKKGFDRQDFQEIVNNCVKSTKVRKVRKDVDFSKLCRILDEHFLNIHLLQLVQKLQSEYPSETSFSSIENIPGRTKYERIDSILKTLKSYGAVDVAFQMALEIKPEDILIRRKIEEIDFSI